MKPSTLKLGPVLLALGLAGTAAHAATATYQFNYLAQANAATTPLLGGTFASLSPAAVSAGSMTITDLTDLALGDGKTGVRISVSLTGLNQFSSGAGTIYSNSLEFSFPGTGSGTGGIEYITSAASLRNISAQFTTGGDGGIEWDEAGSVGNGSSATGSRWGFFQQQNNFVNGSFTQGQTIVFDYLNGDILSGGPNAGTAFNGFSVASLVSVANRNTAAGLPDAWAWLRVRSTDGGIQSTGKWFDPYLLSATNTTTGITTQTLQILAVQAVPEPQTYAMLIGGLGLLWLRRSQARGRAGKLG